MLILQIFDETQSRNCDNRIKKWHSGHWHDYRYIKAMFCFYCLPLDSAFSLSF